MNHPSTLARRATRTAGVGAALLLTSLGLHVAPAGAVTTALTPGSTAPFTTLAYDCTNDAVDLPTTQTFAAGPGTPPSGTGSLKFDLSAKDGNFLDLFRTDAYDGTALADIEDLQYSTSVETDGKQPPYLRLTVDKDADGARDDSLFFIPANNGAQQAVANDTWQTWDVDSGVLNINGDPGSGTTTLAAYVTANPDAVLIESFAGGPEAGALTLAQGCGGANTAASVTYVDEIVIDLAGKDVQKYDLEATAPARTLTVDPKSGAKGSTVTVSGTDCFEPTATFGMGQSYGQSGDELASGTATPAPDGSWSGTLTIPQNADPGATQSVFAVCGTFENEAFRYTNQAFDVSGQANPTGSNGYRMVAGDGGIFTFGARNFHGSTGDMTLNKPIVGGATDTSDYEGYWIVASDGGVFTFSAPFFGSLGDKNITSPAVEIEPHPTGKGYWIVQADGTVTPYGESKHFGDMKGKSLNKPIIGMSVSTTGMGYWLIAEDGGIFNFGDAEFFGSMGDKKLNAPVIDLAPAVDNQGYYLLGRDGGVFTFGSADFKGSTGNMTLNAPVVAMLVNPAGSGYWLAATDGGIFTFGAGVDFLGSMGGTKLNSPVLDLIN
jgi:hypothetical protein